MKVQNMFFLPKRRAKYKRQVEMGMQHTSWAIPFKTLSTFDLVLLLRNHEGESLRAILGKMEMGRKFEV
jgi:hypothetical protein